MNEVSFMLEPPVNSDALNRKIEEFADLPDGWHYGSGVAATEQAVTAARKVKSLLLENNAHDVEAFPDVDGGILVCGYHHDDTVEVLCSPQGTMDLVHEHEKTGAVLKELRDVRKADLERYLGGLGWEARSSFTCCIRSTLARREGASLLLRSNSPPKTAEYHLLMQGALLRTVAENAPTLRDSIVVSSAISESSGAWIRTLSNSNVPLLVNSRALETPAIAIYTDYRTADAAA